MGLFLYITVAKIIFNYVMETDATYNGILDFLRERGWDVQDTYIKDFVAYGNHQMVINGVPVRQKPKTIQATMSFLGFGDIDGVQILGYEIIINEHSIDTVYVYTLEEFIEVYENIFSQFYE